MIRVIRYMKKKEWQLFGIALIFVLAQVGLDLRVPDYMAEITRLVKSSESQMAEIYQAGALMIACALGSVLAAIISKYFTSKLGSQFGYRLREDIFTHVQSFGLEEIDSFTTASLITRSTNDVRQIQNFVSGGLQTVVTMPITFVWALVKISTKQWQWTAFTAACVSLIIMVLTFVVLYAHPRQRRIQGYTDELNKVMREALTGVRVIRAYNAEDYQQEKFQLANDTLTANTLQARRAMGLMNPTMKFINSFLNVGIYTIGAYLISEAGTTQQLEIFSNMIVFSTYAAKIVRSFMQLNRIFMMLPRANVASERIQAVLDTQPKVVDGTETAGLEGIKGKVEFRNVSFRFPDDEQNTLNDISFTAEPGQTVAFIGATGSGKSTLVNLVERFFDASSGEVLVDGRNVKEYTQEALHNIVGYTSQSAVLFTGTVASNVNYGDNGRQKDPDISKALEVAQAADFVSEMENGINSEISRGGTNVSGGQKQRLSIARTIQRAPEIYIFDDTFSALDYRTDKNLRAALKEHTGNATTLIVAQRIGTIRDADKIIVLDEGRIVGTGTHRELMENCQVYQEIALTQLSKEDLL